jgi:hypothetical protein
MNPKHGILSLPLAIFFFTIFFSCSKDESQTAVTKCSGPSCSTRNDMVIATYYIEANQWVQSGRAYSFDFGPALMTASGDIIALIM